ncbi:4Fe-4S dicluster domain-containing protein [Chloroflexota bacterium]
MQLNRRDFLKCSIPATGLFALGGGLISNPGMVEASNPLSSTRYGNAILYDASKCIGCRACETACRRWNKLPPESKPLELSTTSWTVIKSIELNTDSKKERLFLKRQCMHCKKASCVAVCPSGAAARHGEYVEFDQEQCTGCGYCVEACPFDVPHREPPRGTARKCTFCIDRVTQGLKPACVEACPMGAILYGDRAGLIVEGKTRVQTLVAYGKPDANLYGETELGGLGVMYILLKPALLYNLPEAPRQATENVFAQWLSGIATAGVLAVVPFGLLFRRGKQMEENQQSKVEGGRI